MEKLILWKCPEQSVFLAPAFGLLLLFVVIPGIWSIYVSFTNAALAGSAYLNPQFVYFQNYTQMFSDLYFLNSISVTISYVIATSVGESSLALFIALLIKRRPQWQKNTLLSLSLVGFAAPIAVAAYLLSNVFHSRFGSLNFILGVIGIGNISWFSDFPLLTLILCDFWLNLGFYILIFLSALEGVPSEMYDLAAIDGLSGFQELRYVTFPFLKESIQASLILATISGFGMFGLPYLLTKGGPASSTELISLYSYRSSFVLFDLGFGCAVSVVMLVIAIIMGWFYLKAVK